MPIVDDTVAMPKLRIIDSQPLCPDTSAVTFAAKYTRSLARYLGGQHVMFSKHTSVGAARGRTGLAAQRTSMRTSRSVANGQPMRRRQTGWWTTAVAVSNVTEVVRRMLTSSRADGIDVVD